jgi:6-phosphogluconolactonase (cycloisomerase 2 family)
VYSIDELFSTVTVFDWDSDAGELTRRQILPSTAPDDVDDTRGAEIVVHPGGRFVYASNRRGAGDHTPGGPGSDTIAIYRVDPASGYLTHAGWQPTGGIRPRHFTLDGPRLYVAHERSHTIDTHLIDPETGAFTPTGDVVATGSPVCVVFAAFG